MVPKISTTWPTGLLVRSLYLQVRPRRSEKVLRLKSGPVQLRSFCRFLRLQAPQFRRRVSVQSGRQCVLTCGRRVRRYRLNLDLCSRFLLLLRPQCLREELSSFLPEECTYQERLLRKSGIRIRRGAPAPPQYEVWRRKSEERCLLDS